MNLPSLSDEVARYVAPQHRFDEIRERTVAQAGTKICDLAYANAYDGPAAPALLAMRKALESDRGLDLQYTPYGGATITRRVIARSLAPVGGRTWSWRHVVMTPGAMAALNVIFRAIRRDGEPNDVIVVTPCWLDYPLYLAQLGMRVLFAPVERRTMRLDVDAIARALTPATRAVVLSQPANPTGIVYDAGELERLADVLRASDARPLLVSDECHRDIAFDGARIAAPAEHYEATCVVYSFGKSWFIQGQRIGYVAVSPRAPDALAFAERLATWCRVLGIATPTALMQLAVRDLVQQKPVFEAIARRRAAVLAGLTRAGYSVVPSQATFFLYPEVPAGQDDFSFCERLADEGVLVLPAPLFHHRGHFRLSLTAPDDATARALELLAAHGRGAAA